MKRREVLAGAGVFGIASVAGCLGMVGLDEHVATPTSVEAGVLEETGYERTAVDEIGIEREVGAAGVSETISVKNYVTEHEKAVDLELVEGDLDRQRAAVFMVLTTPQIGIPGQEFNPVEEMSAEELVDLVQDNYDDLSNVSHEEDDAVTILGQATTRSRFIADAEFDGHDLEVDVHVSEAVETDDDLLVTIGVYPRQVQTEEEENVTALMEGVSEDADVDVAGGDDEEDGTDENGEEDENTENGEDGENDEDDGLGL